MLPSDEQSVLLGVNRPGQGHSVLEMKLSLLLKDLFDTLLDQFALLSHGQRVELVVGQAEPSVHLLRVKTRGLHMEVIPQLSMVVGPLMGLVLENRALLTREGVRASNAPPDIAHEVSLECEIFLHSGFIVA